MTFPTSSPHIEEIKIPRIDKGLMGLYASAPAASAFGWQNNAKVCFRYNTDFFDNAANTTANCRTVVLNSQGGTVGLANEISGFRRTGSSSRAFIFSILELLYFSQN